MFDKNLFLSDDFNLTSAPFIVRAKITYGAVDKDTTFHAQRIDRIFKINKDITGISLISGMNIPVAMDYEALEKQIYLRDFSSSSVLDLRDKTGIDINRRLIFTFVVNARKDGEADKEEFTFTERQINWAGRKGYETDKNSLGHATSIPLIGMNDPFGKPKVIIDMRVADLEAIVEEAKQFGEFHLDLRSGKKLDFGFKPSTL